MNMCQCMPLELTIRKTSQRTFTCDLAEDVWQKLLERSSTVEEPINQAFRQPRAPMVLKEEAKHVPQKYNFSEEFECHLFDAIMNEKV